MKAILTICCLFFFSTLSAQEADSTAIIEPGKNEVSKIVAEAPEFPGGEIALMKYISDNVKYPRSARRNKIEGKVMVRFIIDEKGKVCEVKVVSKPIGWGLEKAAIEVVEGMPDWKPGKRNGKEVKVAYILPVRFTLSENLPKKKK